MKNTEKDKQIKEQERANRIPRVIVFSITILFFLSLAGLALSIYQWVELRNKLIVTNDENMMLKVTNSKFKEEVTILIRKNTELVENLNLRFSGMSVDIAELKNQRLALDSLYKKLNDSKLAWTLGEVEHALVITEQQLAFSGDISSALTTLSKITNVIDASGILELANIKNLIEDDIKRLTKLNTIDVLAISKKLDRVINEIKILPLEIMKIDQSKNSSFSAPNLSDINVSFVASIWEKITGMIRVDKYSSGDLLILDKEQDFLFRENLKIRLLSARLALMLGKGDMFINELKVVKDLIGKAFDLTSQPAIAAEKLLISLIEKSGNIQIPSIQNTIDVVRQSY